MVLNLVDIDLKKMTIRRIFYKLLEFRLGGFHDLFCTAKEIIHADEFTARFENILLKAQERDIPGYLIICLKPELLRFRYM